MNDPQISDIFERRAFPGPSEPAKLISTHISWVILTPEYSFKIKKPVHFHFLDFSTPALRAHYCREEVRLNRRLAPDTYLGVLPIGRKDGQLRIGARNRPAEDYAVWMRREDNTRELDVLLRDGAVQPTDMKKLAHKLAAFHQAHTLRRIRVDPQELRADFADLFPYAESLSAALGPETAPIFYKMNTWLPGFIERHTKRLCPRPRRIPR
ncbi:MAG: hypothetical protein IPJ82_17455 [Lewinellaceae bacterium]|nr:hypothetical protein [Lewinellaceae bacterium]